MNGNQAALTWAIVVTLTLGGAFSGIAIKESFEEESTNQTTPSSVEKSTPSKEQPKTLKSQPEYNIENELEAIR